MCTAVRAKLYTQKSKENFLYKVVATQELCTATYEYKWRKMNNWRIFDMSGDLVWHGLMETSVCRLQNKSSPRQYNITMGLFTSHAQTDFQRISGMKFDIALQDLVVAWIVNMWPLTLSCTG